MLVPSSTYKYAFRLEKTVPGYNSQSAKLMTLAGASFYTITRLGRPGMGLFNMYKEAGLRAVNDNSQILWPVGRAGL